MERARQEEWSVDTAINITWLTALAWGIEDYDDPALANERLRVALEGVVKWADDLRMYSEPETVLVPELQAAKDALERK